MTDAPAETRPDRRYVPWYRRMIPRWRTVVIGLLILLALPFAIRWYRLSRLPDVPVPFDVEEFSTVDFPAEDNAYHYFNQISQYGNLTPNFPWFSDHFNAGDKPFRQGEQLRWDEIPAEVQAFVLQWQPAIDLLRAGGRCSGSRLCPAEDYRFSTQLAAVEHTRYAIRLITLDVIRRLDAGDVDGAREVLQDAFRASRHVGRRGLLLERYVGIWMHSQIMPGWHQWSRQPQVTVSDLESALHQLQSDWQLTAPASDQHKIETVLVIHETQPPMDLFRYQLSTRLTEQLTQATSDEKRATWAVSFLSKHLPGWERPVLWLLAEPELSARAAKLWLTQELRHCDQPQFQQPPRLPGKLPVYDSKEQTAGLDAATLNQRLPGALYLEYASSDYLNKRQQMEAARQILLETELRLQILFRQTDPSLRPTPEQLLAEFDWPVDPCDPHQGKILHRCDESALVIWSRGTNGKDNGGNNLVPYHPDSDVIVTIPWPGDAQNGNDGE